MISVSHEWESLRQSFAFWDVDPNTLDPSQHALWIINRVLQFGQWDEWVTLFRLYGPERIGKALDQRRLPDHIRQFWQPYFANAEEHIMHPETLHPATAALWQRLGPHLCPPGYVLCGGTALALYLGHRQSDDLDFMTMVAGEPTAMVERIQTIDPTAEIMDRSAHSIHWRINTVKVSYLWQPGVRLDAGLVFDGIPLASLPTLAALKCNAVANRGSRKDFIDLYALLQTGWSLAQVVEAAADQAPRLNRAHLLRSLTYFVDAEREPTPLLYRQWAWEDVRQVLERSVYAYLHQQLSPSKPKGPRL